MKSSLTRAGAVLAATALAVMAFDLATYAGTGESLILGKFNAAAEPTTLKTTGPGPALRLQSLGDSQPSIKVSSSAKVHRLNADLVDGHEAATLTSNAIAFRGGEAGELFPGQAFWELPIGSGAYGIDFRALIIPTSGSPQSPVEVICGVVDLNTLGSRTHVYSADSAVYMGNLPAAMSGSASVYVARSDRPGMLCVSTTNEFQLFQPVKLSFTRLNSRERQQMQVATPPPSARRQLVASLLQ